MRPNLEAGTDIPEATARDRRRLFLRQLKIILRCSTTGAVTTDLRDPADVPKVDHRGGNGFIERRMAQLGRL
jgi:hypothetical protein